MKKGSQMTKADKVRNFLRAGDFRSAFRMCSRFDDLGKHRDDIMSGHGALTNPRFYSQIADVDALIEKGKTAMIDRYKP
tara:strand:- start:4299 stop:4535 length:237 start_codon:yes stop_codon:yes gene_type:complete